VRKLVAADLFCGAGGTSTGLVEACQEMGLACELTAINHWDLAIATHSANHPKSRHLCTDLDSVNPRELYGEGELDLLWASPECTHHSIARGGKPINDQSRATAWCVVRWAEALRPAIILIENVKEFATWGPIGSDGRPLKTKRGKVFMSWARCLEALGYRVDWRVLCAADYGDPTTRQRLFIYAVRGRRKIVWPEPTHAAEESRDLLGGRARWVPARDIIDWNLPGQSIFKRKRPLAEKTLTRIMIGLEKFGLRPFIVGAGGPARAGEPLVVDDPLRTILTKNSSYLTEPSLVHLRGNCNAKDIDKPAPALTAGGGHLGLVQPYLVQVNHGNGKDSNGEPFIVPQSNGQGPQSIDKPLGAVTTTSRGIRLVQPFLIGQQSGATPRSTDEPVPTVATSGAISLAEPFLIAIDHQTGNGQAKPTSEPLSTITKKARHALCQPCLIKFYSSGGQHQSVEVPLGSVTTKDRFGLVQPIVEIEGERYLLDIRFRMLKAHELAAAQGFPRDYKFKGNKTQIVKQIGNAVPKNLAKALVKAALSQTT
jgi:DNA (cytosine-5)-methyltransferase 1